MLAEIDDAHKGHCTAVLYRKFARLGRKKKTLDKGPRPLPQLKLSSGLRAKSFREFQGEWRRQFAHIEAGVVVNEVQVQQLHAPRNPPRQIDIDVCPSPVEVLQIMRRFKNGKVPGPGRLPVDVFKSGGYTIARLLAPLSQ